MILNGLTPVSCSLGVPPGGPVLQFSYGLQFCFDLLLKAEWIATVLQGFLRVSKGKTRAAALFVRAWLQRRLYSNVVVIGITGSVGKTTTKHMTAGMLSTFAPCASTVGSWNDHEATATLIKGLSGEHRYCVAEISGAWPGAIRPAVWMARPQVAVFTAVGRDHYSAFRSIDAIAREKAKLITTLPRDGVAVLNADDQRVRRVGEACTRKAIWVGAHEHADIRLIRATSAWPDSLALEVAWDGAMYKVQTRLHGRHLAAAALLSLGVAVALGLPFDKAIAAVESLEPEEGRMQEVTTPGGIVFIRDDWKAPHWALNAALVHLGEARATRKVLVLGTVSDSSKSPSKRYARIAQEARAVADEIILVGPHAHQVLKAAGKGRTDRVRTFSRLREANEYLRKELRAGDLVLLKGTNPQDHLVRLVIDRTTPVQCWLDDCRLQRFCDSCKHLHEMGSAGAYDSKKPVKVV